MMKRSIAQDETLSLTVFIICINLFASLLFLIFRPQTVRLAIAPTIMPEYHSAYIAFDPYPSYKGSATHIHEVFTSMQQHFNNCLLLTLEGVLEPVQDQLAHEVTATNYLKRGLQFSNWAKKVLSNHSRLEMIQFRDIWGGLAAIEQGIPTIFEVNGLPSIELKERYALLAKSTLDKIAAMEDFCLRKAEHIICPSHVIARHLETRGISTQKVHVIPNSAHVMEEQPAGADFDFPYVVYFGALQPWQGVKTAIKSMKYLEDIAGVRLVICSSHKPKHAKPYHKLVHKLGLSDRVVWQYQLPREQLYGIIKQAIASLAPLAECERNLVQGCSPLKIYESMACETAIIASDLPVTREILSHDENAILIKPDRPASLARQIRLLHEDPNERLRLAGNAKLTLEARGRWQASNDQLKDIYRHLLQPMLY